MGKDTVLIVNADKRFIAITIGKAHILSHDVTFLITLPRRPNIDREMLFTKVVITSPNYQA